MVIEKLTSGVKFDRGLRYKITFNGMQVQYFTLRGLIGFSYELNAYVEKETK